MRFDERDDEDEIGLNGKYKPRRVALALEKVSNGFILEVLGQVYVFSTLDQAFSFITETVTKNYEDSNVR